MAITISGQNNNDKILASDGVLDSISGFNVVGVMTAAQFDVTGKTTTNHISIGNNIHLGNAGIITATTLLGNVTGNVNHESNLLLQISGSEKFRVGNGGQFGIGGANYGTAGQVFTSGGSGSAPTWSTIASDKITEGNTEAEVYDNGSDGRFTVTTEGSERLRIDSSGRVLINTTDGWGSNVKLHLASSGNTYAVITAGTSSNSVLAFSDDGTERGSIDYDHNGDHMLFKTAASERLRIDSGGRIGIKNTSPSSQYFNNLVVGDNSSGDWGMTIRTNSSNKGVIAFSDTDAADANRYDGYIAYHHNDQSMRFNTGGANERLRIAADGTVTVGDGNNLAADYVATMLIDGGSHSKLTLYGATDGTGSVTFSDGSGSGATRRAGFIDFTHGANTTTNQFGIGLADLNHVFIRTAGSNRGSLEVFGTFNESTNPAIEINYNNDARKVFLSNSAGDFNAITRNGSQTKGQLKMFESGILLHNMKNPLDTSTLQTFRTGVYHTTPGSTNTSLSPIVNYLQKGGGGTYDAFEEGNCTLEVNGGGNDHYQPIGFVPRGYNLDQTSFGGQWAGEMWIHQVGSQNPASYGYDSSSYNTWATMSFKCKWDCAHWNAKPSGFWVEHYINYGRAQIAKIDASGTQSQFVIYLLPGSYRIRFNCLRGMAVHRAVSDGAALVMRDGGSFVTYNTLAYSSRNTAFDSEITSGSASFAYST